MLEIMTHSKNEGAQAISLKISAWDFYYFILYRFHRIPGLAKIT